MCQDRLLLPEESFKQINPAKEKTDNSIEQTFKDFSSTNVCGVTSSLLVNRFLNLLVRGL